MSLLPGVMVPPRATTGFMAPWITEWKISTMELKVSINNIDYYLAIILISGCFLGGGAVPGLHLRCEAVEKG